MTNVDSRQSPENNRDGRRLRQSDPLADQDRKVTLQTCPPRRRYLRKTMQELALDAAKLVDLQLELVRVDVTDCWKKAQGGIVILVVGSLSLLCGIFSLIYGLGYLLHHQWGWSEQSSFLTIGGLAIIAGGIATWWGLSRLSHAGRKLSRSRQELSENIRWFREAILHSDNANDE